MNFTDPTFEVEGKIKMTKVLDKSMIKGWHYDIKPDNTSMKWSMTGQRTIIPVYPGGYRDSCILTIDSLNAV